MKGRSKRRRSRRHRTRPARSEPTPRRQRTEPTLALTSAATMYGPLDVPATDIAHVSSARLLELVHALARAEAAAVGIPPTEVLFGAEERAAEGGCDGWTPGCHAVDSDWLPQDKTCWQLKAGKAGQPARIAAELASPSKTAAKDTLKSGGHYVVVASGSVNGEPGRRSRLEALRKAARRKRLPTTHIRVYTAEHISEWLRRFPAVAARFLSRQGLLTVDQWRAHGGREHRYPFHPSASQREQLADLSNLLDGQRAGPTHVHVYGHAGVGKTRLLLEACSAAPWTDWVVYIPEASSNAKRLLTELSGTNARAVMVVDETPTSEVIHYARLAEVAAGRIRVVTIGRGDPGGEAARHTLGMRPHTREETEAVIGAWWPEMPREHRQYVARMSDGYLRLARILGDYVMEHPDATTREILGDREIGPVVRRLLPEADERHLYVLSVLQNVGFAGPLEREGQLVSEALGVDWRAVKSTAFRLKDEFGLVRTGQNLLYMSPRPLALSLAKEAWDQFPEELRRLRDALPEDAAKALDGRLAEVGGGPAAGDLFRREIARFRTLGDFTSETEARFWTVLAEGQPVAAAGRLREALDQSTREEKLAFSGAARRAVMWHVPKLAWDRETFRDALFCLAELSVAENEKWANNATGEFVTRFQVYLGGTQVAYSDRLLVLDEIWNRGPDYHSLVLRSLAKAVDVHESRIGGAEDRGRGPAPPEWHPTPTEAHAARLAAMKRLAERISEAQVGAETALEVVRDVIWPLSHSGYDRELEAVIEATIARFPDLMEAIRRELSSELARAEWQRQHHPEKVDPIPPVVRKLHDRLRETSLRGRVIEHAGPDPWNAVGNDEAIPALAAELIAEPDTLSVLVPWLMSGEAGSGYVLGNALARIDEHDIVARLLEGTDNPGRDSRFAVGYFVGLGERKGDAWIDSLTDRLVGRGGWAATLAFDILTQLHPSPARAEQIAGLLRSGQIEPMRMRVLSHRPWCDDVDDDTFSVLFEAIVAQGSPDGRRAAVELLGSRQHRRKAIAPGLRRLALELVTNRDVYPTRPSHPWGWKELGEEVARDDPGRVARFLLSLQAEPDGRFFLAHDRDAMEVLDACIARDSGSVWNEMKTLLESSPWGRFSIGFPRMLLRKLPSAPIMQWVEQDPGERAGILAHFLTPTFSTDQDLDSQLVECYGTDRDVRSGLFANLVSGTSWGSLADKWKGLAGEMERLAEGTGLPGVRTWAREARQSLLEMERHERGREADDAIRRG